MVFICCVVYYMEGVTPVVFPATKVLLWRALTSGGGR